MSKLRKGDFLPGGIEVINKDASIEFSVTFSDDLHNLWKRKAFIIHKKAS